MRCRRIIIDVARRINAALKSPVTDLVLCTDGTLGSAFSMEAGNRRFIVIATDEYAQETPQMQDRIQSFTLGHESQHVKRRDFPNAFYHVEENERELKTLKSRLEWIGRGVKKGGEAEAQLWSLQGHMVPAMAQVQATMEIFKRAYGSTETSERTQRQKVRINGPVVPPPPNRRRMRNLQK